MKIQIELKKGLENVQFGVTPENVRKAFGEPEEVEELESACEGSVESIVWNYPEIGLNFFFEAANGEPTLCTIESDNIETELFGKKIFQLNQDEIKSVMQANSFIDPEEEDETWGEHRITYDEAQIDFYFVEQELSLVSWSCF